MRVFTILFLIAAASAIASAYDESDENAAFELPSNWYDIRSNIDTSFSCVGRAYGYYADVANDCQLYHVCNPRVVDSHVVYDHSPFICSLGTVFDQQKLTCVHATENFSCAEQINYYVATENHLANEPVTNVVETIVNEPVVPERENVVVDSNVSEHSSEVVSPVVSVTPVVNNVVPVVPVVPVSEPVAPVVSSVVVPAVNVSARSAHEESSEHAEVSNNEHLVNSTVVHHQPIVLNRLSVQNQVPIKMIEQPRKVIPRKSIVNVQKSVQQIAQVPQVAQRVEVPVAKTVHVPQVAQRVEVPVAKSVHVPQVAQRVEVPVAKTVHVPQVAQRVEVPVAKTVHVPQVAQRVEVPVAKSVQQVPQVAQRVEVPVAKTVHVPQVAQRVEVPVAKSVHVPQVAQRVEVSVAKSVHVPQVAQRVEVPVAKTVHVPQVAQRVEVPVAKSVQRPVINVQKAPVKINQHAINQHPISHEVRTTYLYNNQPSWRHHYLNYYPHLVHRYAVRYV